MPTYPTAHLLRTSSVLKHTRDVRLSDIDTLSFLDFRVEDVTDEDFVGLIASVRKHGLLQPVIVRPAAGEGNNGPGRRFELVCGRRRYIACKRLGLDTIPCVVMELDDREAFEVALVENVQRRTLDPVEEAEAFKSYVMNYGRGSVTRLAERISKSEEFVSHRLLMLGLPKPLLDRISRRLLNPSHAMELVWLKDEKEQLELSDEIAKHNLSIRQLRFVIRAVRTGNITVSKAVQNALQMQEARTREGNHGGTDNAGISNEPWMDNSRHTGTSDSDESLRTLNRAILVMRSALAGMDSLAEESPDSSSLRAFLLKERQSVHAILDELVRARVVCKRRGSIQFPAA